VSTPKKKTIMRTFKIDEISGVDRAAQVPAKAVLLKRDVTDEALAKVAILTSPVMGHSHLLRTDDYEGAARKSGETSYVDGHFHPWIRGSDGTITIGEANGHAHEVAVVSKTNEVLPMTPDEQAAFQKSQADATAATKRAERAEKILALTPDERAHFAKLAAPEQDAFLATTPELRKSAVLAAGEADPVVFKSEDGQVFRKSDDARLVAMAKARDEDRRELAKERAERNVLALTKRADELTHLPGETADKVELLKAIDAIPADRREKVLAIVKASDAGLAKAFERAGTTGGGVESDAETKLETLAKAHQAKNAGMTFAKAYDDVLRTSEGIELYEQIQEEKAAAV
jgi:hypothetical protein